MIKEQLNFAHFNSGYIKSAKFSDIDESDGTVAVKTALIATVGKFKSSDGSEHEFTLDRLNTIADYTNKAISTGIPLPVCTDHIKTVGTTVGSVEGEAFTKIITVNDLPNSKATHLIGKPGLFLSNVVIKDPSVVQKVKTNTVTSVSMGLNLEENDQRVLELSLVPISAIPNTGLFAHPASFSFGLNNQEDAYTWEDLEANEQTLDDIKQNYDDLTASLWKLLNNTYNSNAIEITDIAVLQQYVYTALNGFSTRVLDLLGLTNVVVDSTNADAAALSAEQANQMQATQYQDLSNAGISQYSKYSRNKVANFNYKQIATVRKYLRGK